MMNGGGGMCRVPIYRELCVHPSASVAAWPCHWRPDLVQWVSEKETTCGKIACWSSAYILGGYTSAQWAFWIYLYILNGYIHGLGTATHLQRNMTGQSWILPGVLLSSSGKDWESNNPEWGQPVYLKVWCMKQVCRQHRPVCLPSVLMLCMNVGFLGVVCC